MDHQTENMNKTQAVVEATNVEKQFLWETYTKRLGKTWIQDPAGYGITVGRIDDRPVCISITWAIVDGTHIMFVYPTSMVVDHHLIEQWIEKNFPHIRKVDATNFHLAFPH